MRIPLAVVSLSNNDIENGIEVLKSGNLTMGSQVKHFEALMAEYLNVKHFVMVNSGSSANLIMLEALLRPCKGKPKLNPGDGILVPALAWPTTIWPLIQLGLKPIFIDVNLENFSLDLTQASLTMKSSKIPISGLFPIHPLGFGINHIELDNFVNEHGLILINDVCESLGSWRSRVHAGTSGLASTFSFYFSHHITTMEGGGVATNDFALADDLKSIRSHGWSRDRSDTSDWTSGLSTDEAKFCFVTTGYNVRPTEVQAAIGIGQISQIDSFVNKRRDIAKQVSLACQGGPLKVIGEQELSSENERSHSWMLIPICINSNVVTRQTVLEFFHQRNIETRPVLTGNFLRQPAMMSMSDKFDFEKFPNTDWISQNCFVIGCHHEFTNSQIEYLIDSIREFNIFSAS